MSNLYFHLKDKLGQDELYCSYTDYIQSYESRSNLHRLLNCSLVEMSHNHFSFQLLEDRVNIYYKRCLLRQVMVVDGETLDFVLIALSVAETNFGYHKYYENISYIEENYKGFIEKIYKLYKSYWLFQLLTSSNIRKNIKLLVILTEMDRVKLDYLFSEFQYVLSIALDNLSLVNVNNTTYLSVKMKGTDSPSTEYTYVNLDNLTIETDTKIIELADAKLGLFDM